MQPDGKKLSLSAQELRDWASESLAFYQIDLSRLSTLLLAQAFASEKNGIFSTFDLAAPIKALEGLSKSDGTPPADQFQHPPLSGLYKKHFSSPRFLVKNLRNFLQSADGKKLFTKTWDEACSSNESGFIDDKFVGELVQTMTLRPIEIKSQSNRMTGEWIVFHKHNSQNYYLTLAFHGESNSDIHKKILLACDFDQLPFKL